MKKLLRKIQRDEIESFEIYTRLSDLQSNVKNKKILAKIAKDEIKHYKLLEKVTQKSVSSRAWRVRLFVMISRVLWLSFWLRLMELSEAEAQEMYKKIGEKYPKIQKILEDEERHEQELIDMLKEEKLSYMGSVVLGLNDALVELTGALAGFTLALWNTRLIALIGIITGVSASFSMAASEFLSQRQEEGSDMKKAVKSSMYTWGAYILTVACLVTPFFLSSRAYIAMWISLWIALCIIAFFNFYISVAKGHNFKKRFFEMAGISLSVALISFGIGFAVKSFFWLEV